MVTTLSSIPRLDLLLVLTDQGKSFVFIAGADGLQVVVRMPRLPLLANLDLDCLWFSSIEILRNGILVRDRDLWVLEGVTFMRLDILFGDVDFDPRLQFLHAVLGPLLHDALADPRIIVQDHVHLDFGLLPWAALFKVEVPKHSGAVISLGLEGPFDLLLRG